MGYTLRIGEYEMEIEPGSKEDGEFPCLRHEAKIVRLDEAPADGSPTDHTNSRWPSYSGWAEFARETGLTFLFPNNCQGGLMPSHPGVADVLPSHLERVKEAQAAYHKVHGKELGENQNGRLEWLVFWMDWALKNCKRPVFVNS